MIFSYCIPNLKLLFDYQRESLYDLEGLPGKNEIALIEPSEKVECAKINGYSLIFVPFWWDKSIISLSKSIIELRPDLETQIVSINGEKSLTEAVSIPRKPNIQISPGKKKNKERNVRPVEINYFQ